MRLNITVEDKYAHRFDGWFEVSQELAEQGWLIGRNLPTSDFEMVQTQIMEERLATRNDAFSAPVIIYERSGSASLHPARWRQYLKNPMVLGYAKETGFRDRNTYNAPHLQGRFHHTLISTSEPSIPLPHLEASDLDKIETIFQIYAHEARYAQIRFQKNIKTRHRTTDVFFSGTAEYDVDLISEHRRQCCNVLSNLKGLNSLIGIGRCLSPANYPAILRDSKILVSPYGYGEYSWKDFEAIYSGTIVVKPKSDFVTTHGFDIYEAGKYVVSCQPDFSDLEAVIHSIINDINNWSGFAYQARLDLEAAARERTQRARDIAGFLNRCVARMPT